MACGSAGCVKTVSAWLAALGLLFMNCHESKAGEKMFTIGIVCNVLNNASVVEGFKAGMKELGYIEGKNVNYIYHGILGNNDQVISADIRELLAQNADVLLTTSNSTALMAKIAVEDTGTPVVAAACAMPVETGLVKSLSRPGGNLTGVMSTDTMIKGLELLVQTVPGVKKVYIPYNPYDTVSLLYLDELAKAAYVLGIELILSKAHSADEAIAAIKGLPRNAGAIYCIPSPTLSPRNFELSQAAISRGLPMGSGAPADKSVLINFSSDFYSMGKQAARLAHQIRQGIKPADLPIEKSSVFLTINLKTAEAIGIDFTDSVLLQATTIIR